MFLSRGADIDVRQVKSTHTYAIPHVCETLDFAHCSIYVYINCGLLTKMQIKLISLQCSVTDNNITKTVSQTIL